LYPRVVVVVVVVVVVIVVVVVSSSSSCRYGRLGLSSCWGDGAAVDPKAARTTFNARTYLQPQLQKSVKLAEFHKGACALTRSTCTVLMAHAKHRITSTTCR